MHVKPTWIAFQTAWNAIEWNQLARHIAKVTQIALKALAVLGCLYLNPSITITSFVIGFLFPTAMHRLIERINDLFNASYWVPAVAVVGSIFWIPLSLLFVSVFAGSYCGQLLGDWVDQKKSIASLPFASPITSSSCSSTLESYQF